MTHTAVCEFKMLRGLHLSAWSLILTSASECLFSTIISSCATTCFNLILKISDCSRLHGCLEQVQALWIYECRQMSFYTGSSYTGGQNKTKQMCLQACRGALIRLQSRKIHLLLARLTYIYILKTTTHSVAEWACVYLCVCGWWWWWGFTILIR